MSKVRFAVSGPSGHVVRFGECNADVLTLQAGAGETVVQLRAGEKVSPGLSIRNGANQWVESPSAEVLNLIKAKAIATIDSNAEKARQCFLTGGSGQALEYQATEAEARRYAATGFPANPSLADYPFIFAELQAVHAVSGPGLTLRQVAEQVIVQADAWKSVGSAIKQMRRRAKLQIEVATSVAQVRAATIISWPSP